MEVQGWRIIYGAPVGRWEVWYADGSVYSSEATDWFHLPRTGVLILKLWFTDGIVRGVCGSDYYFHTGSVYGSYNAPKEDIDNHYPGAVVLEGQLVTDEQYHAVLRAAKLE
jgi:hypothetical protein